MPHPENSSHRFDRSQAPHPTCHFTDSANAANAANATNGPGGWLWAVTLVLAMLATVTLTARPLHGQAASQAGASGSKRCSNGACPMVSR